MPQPRQRSSRAIVDGPSIDVRVDRVVAGGDGLAHDADGKVVLVAGALPGERVRARVVEVHRSWSHALATHVVDPAAGRHAPPCRYVSEGCGGCSWQHVEPGLQRRLKRQIVADALRRQGGLRGLTDDDPRIVDGPDLASRGYRTTVRAAVTGGRAGFRKAASHHVLPVDDCLVAHPLLADLFRDGIYHECDEVTLRVGERTGERLVLADPAADGVRVPGDVVVVGLDELTQGRRAWFHERAAGRTWRVSAQSFFQTRPDGADSLVAAAAGAVSRWAPDAHALVDLCAGVGLFAGGLAAALPQHDWRIVAVERSRSAVADARHNLADLQAKVVRCSIDAWRPSPAHVVVADPSRAGLGKRAVQAIAASGTELVVLVSCDPASLGRDAGLLTRAGFTFERAELIDLFPHTWHLEAVSAFTRHADTSHADAGGSGAP